MSAANRRRGHDAERAVVRYLKTQGFPDACTTRAKLGHDGATAPGDIDFHPLIRLEVKDVAASAWPTWCRQAAAEAPTGTVPVVVRRTRGVPDPGLWECRVYQWGWLGIVGDLAAFRFHGHACTVDETIWWAFPLADLVAAVRAIDAEATA